MADAMSDRLQPPLERDRIGPKVGLLMGAGGIRGSAHAGVIAVLERAGISVDILVGASIGAMFGAAYAAGWSAERICGMVSDAPRRAVFDFYANRLRIDRSTFIGAILCDLGESTRIEDLPRSFACIALNCHSNQVVALHSGPLLPAVQASFALPWVAERVLIDGSHHRDAGIRAGIPTGVARDMGADIVVRVELSRLARVRSSMPIRPRRLVRTPWHGVAEVRRHVELPSQFADAEADVVIQPEFFGLFANSPLGARFCLTRGMKATEKRIEAIRCLL
jgi:NTE family protein